jgi:anti-sigma factor RsiW
MKETNERPVCHRAEDLVTYLYNEAGETESRDFANHARTCDACRAELAVFQQVHESISLWRNEALGASFTAGFSSAPVMTETASVQPEPRRLSALAALRQFFAVSPLWLRGATAFAALMLCVLAVLAISR